MGIEYRKPTVIRLVLAIVVIVVSIVSSLLLRVLIEDSSREQARQNLSQVKYCYTQGIQNLSLMETLNICTSKVRVGFTGDVYVLDASTKEFVFENSTDVPQGNLVFTEESVGQYFKDWSSGNIALGHMMLGRDSDQSTDVSYLFDTDKEWIEWKYLPDSVVHTDERRLIAVHGVQSNEAIEKFKQLECYWFACATLIVFALLVSHSAEVKNVRRRRADDRQRE